MVMDVILLVIIPLALLKDLCCQTKTISKKKRIKSKIMTIIACFCFTVVFFVDALIFNTYIGQVSTTEKVATPGEESSQKTTTFFENIMSGKVIEDIANMESGTWYDLTLA